MRPDYAEPSYARLAIAAQEKWRKGYGECLDCGRSNTIYSGIRGTGEILKCEDTTCEHEPVYREPGLVIAGSGSGSGYVRMAKQNAEDLGLNVRALDSPGDFTAVLEGRVKPSRTDIEGWIEGRKEGALPGENKCRNIDAVSESARREREKDRASALGETGYINYSSGWVDNGRAMANVMAQCVKLARLRNQQPGGGRITFLRGKAAHLLFSQDLNEPSKATGVALVNDHNVHADLTILATGAYTPSLIDLRGRAEARGQAMAYLALTSSEAHTLRDTPVLINMGTGMFAIPPVLASCPQPRVNNNNNNNHSPTKTWLLKVAQHAYGYANPTALTVNMPGNIRKEITASVPAAQYSPIPTEAGRALRAFLQSIHPALGSRPFVATRLCWYTDTPTGDFLIDYHPEYAGLFLATGGSGHGFKFLPVLGERIVEKIEGRLESDLDELWRWREGVSLPFQDTEDGSRGGRKGEVLGREWAAAAEGMAEKAKL